ncbi:MAG: hypothetical protein JWN04_6201 [Myxococcaceae bacterium]|nr:hypothetical protein [Myxococcaceae bacterium]
MRLAGSSYSIALCFGIALCACSDDASSDGTFASPYGDPGGSTVCAAGTYLVGWKCLASVPDGGSPPAPMHDASIDGAASPADASSDAALSADARAVEGAPR